MPLSKSKSQMPFSKSKMPFAERKRKLSFSESKNEMPFSESSETILLKRGDRRVRIFSAHNNWWVTPEVTLPLPYQRSANVFLNSLRQGVKIMYYCKNVHSKSLKCAK